MGIRLLLIVMAPGIVRGQKCMAMNTKISKRNMKLMLHMIAALQLPIIVLDKLNVLIFILDFSSKGNNGVLMCSSAVRNPEKSLSRHRTNKKAQKVYERPVKQTALNRYNNVKDN